MDSEFVVRGKPLMFAIDNIDFTEDTPFGQNSTHGTVVVIFQEDIEGEKFNPPLDIPITSKDIDTTIEYLSLEDIAPR